MIGECGYILLHLVFKQRELLLTLSCPAALRILAPKQPDRSWIYVHATQGTESGREVFKGSKDTASLLVCTRKKYIFCLKGADFLCYEGDF